MKLTGIRRKIHKNQLKYYLFFVVFLSLLLCNWEEVDEIYEDYVSKKYCKPWYFKGGLVRPTRHESSLKLWPDEDDGHRILNQLMFLPETQPTIKKKIFIQKPKVFRARYGSKTFESLKCPIKDCEIVSREDKADAVVFLDNITKNRHPSTLNQVWILYMLEAPLYTGKVIKQNSVNWTASYRFDSDLVTPYDIWVYYDDWNKTGKVYTNFAKSKSRKVAWFVSNCRSKNLRMEYAKKLSEYIPVDIYGSCGDKKCSRKKSSFCRKMISDKYKFYLSFENANCRDYITEKFYLNGLQSGAIPIVMGAPKVDYEKVAPLNSFIHVEDFESPKHLADYLNLLDKDDNLYNQYFQWRGKGEFINTYFLCRLCAMLHAGRSNYYYNKFYQWWRKPFVCTKTFWSSKNNENIFKSLVIAKRKL